MTDVRNCKSCGFPIPVARLMAIPNSTLCKACKEQNDDDKTIGFMSWSHKTAPEIITSATVGEAAIRELHRYSRKGVHASLPLHSPKNPRFAHANRAQSGGAEFDAQRRPESPASRDGEGVTNLLPATCHPAKPRVTPDGKCLQCVLQWYERRVKR